MLMTVDQIKAMVDDLAAERDAALAALAPHVVTLGDFTEYGGTVAVSQPPLGRGSALTRYVQAPGVSTAAGRAVSKSGTNPLYLARLDIKSGAPAGGFTIEGSDQGHEHNGLYATAPNGGLLRDVTVLGGSAGSGNAPPKEAFGPGFNRCVDFVAEDITSLPGYRTVTGTMIGTNNSQRFTAIRFVAHGSTGGTGHAIWQTDDYTDIDGDYSGNRRAINTEQPGGVHRMVRTNFGRNDAKGRVMTFNGFRTKARLEVHDPIWEDDGRPLGFAVFPNYTLNGKVAPNLVTDVRIFEHGVDVTADRRFRIGAIG
jgi:hypothetical protein